MKELRIGIIGTGMISHRHMCVWAKIPGVKVVAASEINEAILRAWGEKYNISTENLYTDFREMLKRDDLDCIDVCVHNNLHVPIAVEVMRAGFPCYSEKPMAGSYADAKTLYDAQKVFGQKLAIQISSIFSYQTRLAKSMVEEGKLGKIYHARSVGHRREGRPGWDMPAFSKDFVNKEIGGHGPLFDLGIYHLAQMLYIMGMPELESVYGLSSADYYRDPQRSPKGLAYEVDDLGVGLAKFKEGISMDIYEDWAMHMDDVGTSFIAGSYGGIKLIDVDTTGGRLAAEANGGQVQKPDIRFYGVEKGNQVEITYNCQLAEFQETIWHPEMAVYNDNQRQWAAYVRGDLDDTTRIDTPYIAMQTALLSEGIYISNELGRSVTADEIKEISKSTAVRVQDTPWGKIEYNF